MEKTNIRYHRAITTEELYGILNLQKENLRYLISDEVSEKEGFVTLKHDFNTLKKMNDACAHCIAKRDGKVVGYALSMLQEFKNDIPILVPMFKEIDQVIQEQNLSSNYIVMGQICIDKNARGIGVFRGLYQYMVQELKNDFDAIITEVDIKNTRSCNAHKAVGFKFLKNYTSNDQLWEVIILRL